MAGEEAVIAEVGSSLPAPTKHFKRLLRHVSEERMCEFRHVCPFLGKCPHKAAELFPFQMFSASSLLSLSPQGHSL